MKLDLRFHFRSFFWISEFCHFWHFSRQLNVVKTIEFWQIFPEFFREIKVENSKTKTFTFWRIFDVFSATEKIENVIVGTFFHIYATYQNKWIFDFLNSERKGKNSKQIGKLIRTFLKLIWINFLKSIIAFINEKIEKSILEYSRNKIDLAMCSKRCRIFRAKWIILLRIKNMKIFLIE